MKNQVVLWAVDPFEKDLKLDPETAKELGLWAKQRGVEIEPVYLFTPMGPVEAIATSNIQTKIARFFKKNGIPVREPVILRNRTSSLAKGIERLLEHAKKVRADMIVVSSHGRRNIARLLLGSFAETLLSLSPIPVLFMNQHRRPKGASFSKALWSTDFSKRCKGPFDKFIENSKRFSDDLVIFNDAGIPSEMLAYFSLEITRPTLNDWLERQEQRARSEAGHWTKNARAHGLKAISSVEQGYGSLSDSILGAARDNKVGLIAMASTRGPLEAAMLGSDARSVFRSSEFPVLVYGPEFMSGKSKVPAKKPKETFAVAARS